MSQKIIKKRIFFSRVLFINVPVLLLVVYLFFFFGILVVISNCKFIFNILISIFVVSGAISNFEDKYQHFLFSSIFCETKIKFLLIIETKICYFLFERKKYLIILSRDKFQKLYLKISIMKKRCIFIYKERRKNVI